MEFKKIYEQTLQFCRDNEALIEVALFVLGFAESLVVISFFVPASALFLVIAGLQEASGGAFWPILLAGGAGAFAGDVASYAAGRYFKDDLHRRWPFRDHPGWLEGARAFLDRWGILGIIAAKFVGPLRPLAPAVCGMLHMPLIPFLASSALSSLLWAFAFLAPSYYGLKFMGL
jgi:membrane protein DedA with SNARE-associated domain